jgi:uncharacterized repeat protein (TIGR03803 family)
MLRTWLSPGSHPRPRVEGAGRLGSEGSSVGGLIFDASGALYGTTAGGNTTCLDCGTVFKLTPPLIPGGAWIYTVLHVFSGSEGLSSNGLIFDASGALYGTTNGGGSNTICPFNVDFGCGTVFKLAPPSTEGGAWTHTVLYVFGGIDGAEPVAGLVIDGSGALYGTTFTGGGNTSCGGCGTVFKLTPPSTAGGAWTHTVLHAFDGNDGSYPEAGLIMNAGALYGTTLYGGSSGYGTVFKLVTFAGTPGKANCYGKSVSALAQQFKGLNAAAADLGFSSIKALQNAILTFCEG